MIFLGGMQMIFYMIGNIFWVTFQSYDTILGLTRSRWKLIEILALDSNFRCTRTSNNLFDMCLYGSQKPGKWHLDQISITCNVEPRQGNQPWPLLINRVVDDGQPFAGIAQSNRVNCNQMTLTFKMASPSWTNIFSWSRLTMWVSLRCFFGNHLSEQGFDGWNLLSINRYNRNRGCRVETETRFTNAGTMSAITIHIQWRMNCHRMLKQCANTVCSVQFTIFFFFQCSDISISSGSAPRERVHSHNMTEIMQVYSSSLLVPTCAY